uniref:General transcription factor 3C polypeptide 1 n=1 Tax=Tetraselmis sp. GSL018 TaxID=582737 RepID=A0A061SD65_9CHLO
MSTGGKAAEELRRTLLAEGYSEITSARAARLLAAVLQKRFLLLNKAKQLLIKDEINVSHPASYATGSSSRIHTKTLRFLVRAVSARGHVKAVSVSRSESFPLGKASRKAEFVEVLFPADEPVTGELLREVREEARAARRRSAGTFYGCLEARRTGAGPSAEASEEGGGGPSSAPPPKRPRSGPEEGAAETAEGDAASGSNLTQLLVGNGFLSSTATRLQLLHFFLCRVLQVVHVPGDASSEWVPGSLQRAVFPEDFFQGLPSIGALMRSSSYQKLQPEFSQTVSAKQVHDKLPLDLYCQLVGVRQRPEEFPARAPQGATVGDLTKEQLLEFHGTHRHLRCAMSRFVLDLTHLAEMGLLEIGEKESQKSLNFSFKVVFRPYLEEVCFQNAKTKRRMLRVFDIRTELEGYWAVVNYRCLSGRELLQTMQPFSANMLRTFYSLRSWETSRLLSLHQLNALMAQMNDCQKNRCLGWLECKAIADSMNLSYPQVRAVFKRMRRPRKQAHDVTSSRGKRAMCREEIDLGRPEKIVNKRFAVGHWFRDPVAARLHRKAVRASRRKREGRSNVFTFTEKEFNQYRSAPGQDEFLWTEEADTALLRAYIRKRISRPKEPDFSLPLAGNPCPDEFKAIERLQQFRKVNLTSTSFRCLQALAVQVCWKTSFSDHQLLQIH